MWGYPGIAHLYTLLDSLDFGAFVIKNYADWFFTVGLVYAAILPATVTQHSDTS